MTDHDIEGRLNDLEQRLEALEHPPTPASRAAEAAEGDPGTFWILDGLERRLGDSPGAVAFAGAWQRPGHSGPTGRLGWQLGLPVDTVLALDWAEHSSRLAALGHPVRLTLLQRILTGTTETAQLVTGEDLGTSGQLHHHLRALVAAGWLTSPRRGHYEVPSVRIIPLLALILAVRDD